MNDEISGKTLRYFGWTVGSILVLIGFWPLIWRNTDPYWWGFVAAGCLMVPGTIFPRSLFWAYKGWMTAGHVLGWINTRIILGAVFVGVITPIGMVRRWLGKDPMGCKLRPDLESYRIPRLPRSAAHLKRQF
jgi:hypothetical protein